MVGVPVENALLVSTTIFMELRTEQYSLLCWRYRNNKQVGKLSKIAEPVSCDRKMANHRYRNLLYLFDENQTVPRARARATEVAVSRNTTLKRNTPVCMDYPK